MTGLPREQVRRVTCPAGEAAFVPLALVELVFGEYAARATIMLAGGTWTDTNLRNITSTIRSSVRELDCEWSGDVEGELTRDGEFLWQCPQCGADHATDVTRED